MENLTLSKKICQFYDLLSHTTVDLPNSYELINPFAGNNAKDVEMVYKTFYNKYYNDANKRVKILGSSPARRGTALTGVPFEDAEHLYLYSGIKLTGFHINKASSNFLYDVIEKYGGSKKFYSKFYLNFICPLGIVKTNDKGNKVNCNYYENKKLQSALEKFIIKSIKKQLTFNIDTTVCFCIGCGENFKYLNSLNSKYKIFKSIIPLEHPRFIMQYHSKDYEKYLEKYLKALKY